MNIESGKWKVERFAVAVCVVMLSTFHFSFSSLHSQTVEFSMNGWLYRDAFTLRLMQHGVSPDSGYTIHYTVDGSTPTAASAIYSEPLPLSHSSIPH